jgi:hypothetical protein
MDDRTYLDKLIDDWVPPDGVSLSATSHPVTSWYRRLWLWLFHRDLRKSSLTTRYIEIDDRHG